MVGGWGGGWAPWLMTGRVKFEGNTHGGIGSPPLDTPHHPSHPDHLCLPSVAPLLLLMQPLLDGVFDYLPCPTDVVNYALDVNKDEQELVRKGGDGYNIYTQVVGIM